MNSTRLCVRVSWSVDVHDENKKLLGIRYRCVYVEFSTDAAAFPLRNRLRFYAYDVRL